MKSLIKRLIRRCGFDIRRYDPSTSEMAQLMTMFSGHGVNLVFDVGANIGQFGRSLRDAGYRGRIVSFEPLSSAREQLLRQSQSDQLWEVAPRGAIGSENGEIEIHIAGNSVSSSAMDMLAAHESAAPESAYIGSERTPLRRVDSIAGDYLRSDSVLFLKIDTQGYEEQVFAGTQGILDRIAGLQLELSLVPLYDGQRLFDDLVKQVAGAGFALWGLAPVFVDPQSGRLLQVDATFFRS